MMGIENIITFMITALFFIMTPGIDTVFILNKSLGQGVKSGVYATLGVSSGVLIHTILATLGFSILIAKSPYAFSIIKYSGTVYLIYLGYVKLTEKQNLFSENKEDEVKKGGRAAFWSGFLTNTLNPKVALFFLAFFPQFISPAKMEDSVPFLILGLIYALIGVIWFLVLTLFASICSQKIKNDPNVSLWLNRLSGIVFILMAIRMALYSPIN